MMEKAKGYFIHNREIFQLDGYTHIKDVCSEPERFGLKREEVKDGYEQFSELYGQEGYASSMIMLKLFRRGWIRVRKYQQRISVEGGELIDFKTCKDLLIGVGFHPDELVVFNMIKGEVLVDKHTTYLRRI
jgi:hypothetical protein